MDERFAYLLGLIYGNGRIVQGNISSRVLIDIPHKNLQDDNGFDVQVYVTATIPVIQAIIGGLLGIVINSEQVDSKTTLYFDLDNQSLSMAHLRNYTDNVSTCREMRIHPDIFLEGESVRLSVLQGIGDVTGYVRQSNYFFTKPKHRVYIEIPKNWYLAIDICNLLKSCEIPVHNLNWGHPNMRDPQNKGNNWRKEHQIKIYVNQYMRVGFRARHKQASLTALNQELLTLDQNFIASTNRFYWEGVDRRKIKPVHPDENDNFIPVAIRGIHYNSWKDIARDLGYHA